MRLHYFAITLLTVFSFAYPSVSKSQCVGGFTDSIDSLTVYFTSTATGAYDVIEYDFGDGNYSYQVEDPVHTYSSSGFYQVCQIIYDSATFTCFDYVCDTLIIGDATCMAEFGWFPDGLDVEFYNYSMGTYDSLSWDFGDGFTSNDTMPTHSYDSAGSYSVCLSLFDSSGTICDSTCYQIYVDTNSCDADFTYSANGLTVDFTNASTGGYNAVSWDFGDNLGFSQDEDPTYTYLVAGTYTVCLYVYDTLNWTCYAESCQEITVTTGGGGSCEADFNYEIGGLTIECTNTSTGSFLTAIWDYGDGSTPTTQESHTYSEPGSYDVCLTVGNLIPFCLDQTCKTITVYEIDCFPVISYSFDPNTNVYSFSGSGTQGDYDAVEWSFGDGNTSSFPNPSYTYNQPGEYEVCLTTYRDSNMCGMGCTVISVYPLGLNDRGYTGISVYPNPSNGQFIVDRGNAAGPVQITLSDLAGRILSQQTTRDQKVSMNYDIPAGVYLLEVCDEFGGEEVVRLVIK